MKVSMPYLNRRQFSRNALVIASSLPLASLSFGQSTWSEIQRKARGQTVVMNAWGGSERINAYLVIEGLLDEIEGAGFHRLNRHRNIGMARHEEYRQIDATPAKDLLQFQTAHRGHANIEQQAARLARRDKHIKELFCRGMQLDGPAHGVEQKA